MGAIKITIPSALISILFAGKLTMNSLKAILGGIDWFIDKSGEVFKWLILGLIISIAYDVMMRYLFNMPTIWSFEVSYMLGGSMMVLGGGYLILHGGHVKIDLIYSRLSPRQQLILDIVLTILLFFPMAAILTRFSLQFAIHSWTLSETSTKSVWAPPLFPLRAIVFLAFCLLDIAGISWFIRNVMRLITREGL